MHANMAWQQAHALEQDHMTVQAPVCLSTELKAQCASQSSVHQPASAVLALVRPVHK